MLKNPTGGHKVCGIFDRKVLNKIILNTIEQKFGIAIRTYLVYYKGRIKLCFVKD